MNTGRILTVVCIAATLVGGAALAAEPAKGKAVAAAIEKLTGARTKIVWVRSVVAGKGHVDADDGIFYQLMVFDTHEAKERVLLPGPASCAYPWITGDGAHVVFTLLGGAGKVCVVDWDGTNRKELSDGFALALWRDPASGVQWIYVGNNYAQNDYRDRNHATAGITRYRLDNPSVKELVWNKTYILEQRVSLSGDGKRLGSGFPWPHQGVADLASGTWKKYGQGCNSSIAPDTSYRFFHMNGNHIDITMYDDGGANPRVIPVNCKPGGMFWSPKWTSHVRFLAVAGPFAAGFNYAPGSNIHIGRFDEAFAKVEAWAQVSDGPVRDTHGYAWIETPEIRNSRKAGASKQGDRTLEGTASVADRVAPKLLSAAKLDDRRVLLTCSEPVRIDRAIVTRTDGAPAVKLGLDSEGRGIIAEFAAPLAAKETLTVAGVTDRAQAPNKMGAARTQIVPPDWPSNRAGVSYLWKNARTGNVIFDERIGLPVTTALSGGGEARFNREGAAMAAGGAFAPSPGSPRRIFEGIKKTHQFSFEIVVASADLAQTRGNDDQPLAIANWGSGWGNGIFWLLQEKDKLLVGLSRQGGDAKPEVFEMATLPDTKPHHVIVSVAAKRLACYLDGKKVKEIDPSPAQILEVSAPPLTFAGYRPDPGKKTWHGTFEYVAMYSRFIEEPEAAKNAAAVVADLAKRKALPRIEVQATLIAKSNVPDPDQMAPYRNALIVNEYSVDKVLKGTYADKTIRVAQWGMIDLKPTPLAAQEPGTSVKLVLEKFTDHDELVPELISDTLKEDLDMKLYTDVNL